MSAESQIERLGYSHSSTAKLGLRRHYPGNLVVYLTAVVVGIVASVISLVLLINILAVMYPPPKTEGISEVSFILLAPLPIAVAVIGFAAGFYLVLRFSN